jgi:ribosomal protein L28
MLQQEAAIAVQLATCTASGCFCCSAVDNANAVRMPCLPCVVPTRMLPCLLDLMLVYLICLSGKFVSCRSKILRKPNVHKRRLYSQALGEKIQLNVTTTALRYARRSAQQQQQQYCQNRGRGLFGWRVSTKEVAASKCWRVGMCRYDWV